MKVVMWLSPDCTSNPFLSRVTAKGGCEREKGVWETAYTQLGLGITFKVCASIGMSFLDQLKSTGSQHAAKCFLGVPSDRPLYSCAPGLGSPQRVLADS